MYKKIMFTIITLCICLVLNACSSVQIPKEESLSTTTQKQQEEKKALTEHDLTDENKPVNDSFDGMEIDSPDDLTIEKLIEQLRKDQIVTGTPKDIKDGVKGALRTTQIGSALILQFDTKDLSAFSNAYETGSIRFQEKDYKVTAINGQFMLILLDDSNQEKAAASFQKSQSSDGRIINF